MLVGGSSMNCAVLTFRKKVPFNWKPITLIALESCAILVIPRKLLDW
jgi:hypothetical protein